MANPLMNQMNNSMNLISRFNQFKKTLQGKNPSDVLNSLMASGKYTNEQLEQAKSLANQFKSLLK